MRPSAGTVFTAALILRLAFIALWPNSALTPDTGQYTAHADNLIAGNGFSLDGKTPSAGRAPAYPVLLAFTRSVFGKSSTSVEAIQAVLDSGSAVYVFWTGTALAGPAVGGLAGMLYAIHPVFIAYTSYMVTETLFLHLWLLFLFLFIRAIEYDNAPQIAAAGAVFSLMLLCRPAHIYFPPLLALPFLLRVRPLKRAALLFALFGLTATAVLVPWTLRNHARFGRAIPVMVGGTSAWWAGSVPWELGLQDAYDVAGTTELKTPEADARFLAEAKKNWKTYFWKNLAHMPARFRKLWIVSHSSVFGIDRPNSEYKTDRRWGPLAAKALLFILQGVILSMGLLGAWVLRDHWRRWAILALPVLYINGHLLNDWRVGRYHLSAIPCLLLLAAWGWRHLRYDDAMSERRS